MYFNSTFKDCVLYGKIDCVLYGKIYEDSGLTVLTLTTNVN